MKDGAVKTPTSAVLCQTKEQTPRGVAEEGLGEIPGSEWGLGCWST